jgi:hypothetical protein
MRTRSGTAHPIGRLTVGEKERCSRSSRQRCTRRGEDIGVAMLDAEGPSSMARYENVALWNGHEFDPRMDESASTQVRSGPTEAHLEHDRMER